MTLFRVYLLLFTAVLLAASCPWANVAAQDDTTERITDREPMPVEDDEDLDEPSADLVPDAPDVGAMDVLPSTTVVGQLSGSDANVTTPTLTSTNVEQVGSATTVITGEQIRASGYSSVSDVLRGTAGLDVVQQGAPGGLTTVFLRGAESRHTKVLLDGIPINDPSSASRLFDFSNLSVDNVERIEIVRGPQSTLYGTDAIGGVINVITKQGKGPATATARFQGGSYGMTRNSANVSGGTERYHYSLGGSYYYTDGFSSASERLGNTEDDYHRLGTLDGRFGWMPSEDVEVETIFRWSDARTAIDGFNFFEGVPKDDLMRFNLSESFFSRIQARWSSMDGNIEQQVAFDYTNYDRKDTDDLFPGDFQGQTRKVEWRANVLLTPDNTLTVGADYLDEHGADNYGLDASQYKSGIYLQDQFTIFDRLYGIAGFRWDDWNTAGPARTYQFRTVYQLRETNTSFHATLGTGFYAPSLAEIAFGAPGGLLPERSKGWDVGVTQRLFDDRVVIETYYFRNDYSNLLLFDFTIPPFGALINGGRARTHGVEVMGLWRLGPSTTVNASYTRTDSERVETKTVLPRRPRDKGTAGITQRFWCDRATVNLYAMFFGDSEDTNAALLDGYTLLNMAANYQLSDRTRLFCRLDNLLNQHYEVIDGYSTPAFASFGGIDVTW